MIKRMLAGYVIGVILLGSAMLIVSIAVPSGHITNMLTALFVIPAIAVIALTSILFVIDFVDDRL